MQPWGRLQGGPAPQHTLDSRCLEQPLQHTARAPMLQTLVRGQRVLGPVTSMTELAHVQCIRLFMFVLKVPLQ